MFEIKKAKGGYMVYLKAENGEILMTSEILKTKKNAYVNKHSCIKNVTKYALTIANQITLKDLLSDIKKYGYQKLDITDYPCYELLVKPTEVEEAVINPKNKNPKKKVVKKATKKKIIKTPKK